MNIDLIVVGAGLSGATIANKAAADGMKVLIIEKKDVVGGNVSEHVQDGILVHTFGPHIFHTNNEEVVKYMSKFWKLNDFQNAVEAEVNGELIPLPFNFEAIDKFWPEHTERIKELIRSEFGKDSRVSIFDFMNSSHAHVRKLADFVYKNIFENYTTKMWGIKPNEIDESILNRVPITAGYGKRYFSDKYEGIPIDGYKAAVEKMLDHRNITLKTGVNAFEFLERKDTFFFVNDEPIEIPIVYTGSLDEFFNNELGHLPYRSLEFEWENINVRKHQATAVVNYPAHPKMTRITEYKHFTRQEAENTVISKEFPGEFNPKANHWNVPYYPIGNDDSRSQYQKYAEKASKIPNLYLAGRLATYKYLNMDQAIAQAMEVYGKIKERVGK